MHAAPAPDGPGEGEAARVEGRSEPHVTGEELSFTLADPQQVLAGVRLWTDIPLGDPAPDLGFTRRGDAWTLSIPTPPVDRLEYLFIARERGAADDASSDDSGPRPPPGRPQEGPEVWLVDPANPRRVGGAFGDHSELLLPGYVPPAWLEAPTVESTRETLTLETEAGPIDVQVWAPRALADDERAPLLLAHDGPEFDAFAGLTQAVGAAIAAGRLPAARVALLAPGPRDERYGANAVYARALATEAVPALAERCPSRHAPALLGASLGGLAALHAHWHHPGTFGALILASGSFFTPELDPQESGFSRWREVTDFVARVASAAPDDPAARLLPPTAVVCGTAEENHANNVSMRDHLHALGGEVSWATARDGHCYTCWRDLLDPHAVSLLAAAWR